MLWRGTVFVVTQMTDFFAGFGDRGAVRVCPGGIRVVPHDKLVQLYLLVCAGGTGAERRVGVCWVWENFDLEITFLVVRKASAPVFVHNQTAISIASDAALHKRL